MLKMKVEHVCANIWIEILLFLDEVHVERIRATCRALEQIGHHNIIWQTLYWRYFNQVSSSVISWKEKFQLKYLVNKAWIYGSFEYRHDQKILAHQEGVTCVCTFVPIPILATGSFDKTIKLWNFADSTPECQKVLTGHTDTVWKVVADHENRLFTASFDGTVRLWDFSHAEQPTSVFRGHLDRILSMNVQSSGNTVVTGSREGSMKFWDTRTGTCVGTVLAYTRCAYSLARDNNHTIYCGGTTDIERWDERMLREPMSKLQGHTRAVMALELMSNGVLLSGSKDNTMRVWDVTSQDTISPKLSIYAHAGALRSVKTLENLIISISNDHTVKVWQMPKKEMMQLNFLYTIRSHDAQVSGCSIREDQLISASMDGTVAIHDFTCYRSKFKLCSTAA